MRMMLSSRGLSFFSTAAIFSLRLMFMSPGGPQRLEYPIGKVLFKTDGYISHPRISPDGKRVAFLEHPLYGDDRGYLDLVDAGGNVKRLTSESQGEEGVAWSPDGREIWYAAAKETGDERNVVAETPPGKSRIVSDTPGYTSVWDIAADGRLLTSDESITAAQIVASPASGPEREVSSL